MISQSVKRRKGVALIVCVATMMSLSIMAVTFVRMMNYEEASAGNYTALVDARLTAAAGIERVKALMYEDIRRFGFVTTQTEATTYGYAKPADFWYPYAQGVRPTPNPVYNSVEIASRNRALLSLRAGQNASYSYSGILGSQIGATTNRRGRYDVNGNFYALKIEDLQGKFNVNSHIPLTLAGAWDSTAGRQRRADTIVNGILAALASACGIHSSDCGPIADAIRPIRDTQATFYTSKKELEAMVASFCPNSTTAQKSKFLDNLCVHSWMDESARSFTRSTLNPPQPYAGNYGVYYREMRAPVNINTVSRELLMVLISRIRTRIHLYETTRTVANESDYNTQGSPGVMQTETTLSFALRSYDVSFAAYAWTLADLLLANIPASQTIRSAAQLEALIDNPANLPDGNLPPPAAAWISNDAAARKRWYQACRDALKSNFNPNALDNHWNPNKPAFRELTRADLYNTSSTISGSYAPGYTTDLCFSDNGRAEITSFGVITANNFTTTVACTTLRSSIELCEIQTHSTQKDFYEPFTLNASTYTPSFSSTLSYPEKNVAAVGGYQDSHVGSVEPQATVQAAIAGGVLMTQTFPGTVPPALIAKASAYQPMLTSIASLRNTLNNVLPDGLFSKFTMYDGAGYPYRYYTLPTFTNGSTLPDRTQNTPSGSRLGNYQGSVEFWVKPEIAGGEAFTCSYMSFSQVSTLLSWLDPKTSTWKPFREGTQTFILKNTLGKLKVSRLYFGGYFDNAGNYFGTQYYKYCDGRRVYSKREIICDISGWEAHKWYHVLVCWDDTSTDLGNSLVLFVNGLKAGHAQYYLGETGNTSHPVFCVSNERIPASSGEVAQNDSNANAKSMDGMFINGLYRNQHNTIENVVFRYATQIHSQGNATMDGVRTYNARLYDKNAGAAFTRARFPASATYSHSFPVLKTATLGPLRWSAYPYRVGSNTYVSLTASTTGSSTGVSHSAATTSTTPGFAGQGLTPTYRVVQPGDTVNYTATFTSAGSDGYCPTLDSVSLLLMTNETRVYETLD